MTDSGVFAIAAVLAAAYHFPTWSIAALAIVAGVLVLNAFRPPRAPGR